MMNLMHKGFVEDMLLYSGTGTFYLEFRNSDFEIEVGARTGEEQGV